MGTYSNGDRVRILGMRNGFTYIEFVTGRNNGIMCKVPNSWVVED